MRLRQRRDMTVQCNIHAVTPKCPCNTCGTQPIDLLHNYVTISRALLRLAKVTVRMCVR